MSDVICRLAMPSDLEAVSRLLAQSYPALLFADYTAEVLADVLPVITRARAELLASGTYWVAQMGGHLVGAGGWTQDSPNGAASVPSVGNVRHVATHPDYVRRGVGKALMSKAMGQARDHGISRLNCLSTLTAVPFYAAIGFQVDEPLDVVLTGGAMMPAVQMHSDM